MVARVRHITIDCADAHALASFWAAVIDGELADDDEPGDPEALVTTASAPPLLFVTVPERKSVKNRVHLDLQPMAGPRDDEVERVLALGATLVADRRNVDGTGWVTLADPEGNEFCIERSAAERGD